MDSQVRISTEKDDIDFDRLHHFLSKESYWAQHIPKDILLKAIQNSVCFSVIHEKDGFIGFARMVTDSATFGYLGDVYIEKNYRNKGVGKILLTYLMNYPNFKYLRNWSLYTKDAHKFYEQFGWKSLENIERAMVIKKDAKLLYGEMN